MLKPSKNPEINVSGAVSFAAWLFFIINLPVFGAVPGPSPLDPQAVLDGNPVPPVSGCSVFTLAKGTQVYFGGNDDYVEPDSYYWVDDGGEDGYGTIWLGRPDNVQQGVNEAGLAYDANGLPRYDTNPHSERAPVSGGYTSYPVQIMRECATVEEVINWVETHRWHSFMHDQMQFADAGGDAVIISAGTDGEIVLTRKNPGDGFLVSTNFNVANPSNGFSYPCWRYDTATRILEELVSGNGSLSVEEASGVLEAVHVSGGSSWTIASFLVDFSNGKLYIYFFHQFNDPLILDIAEELADPHPAGPLSRMFPEEVQSEALRRYEAIQEEALRGRRLGILWYGLVIVSLLLYLLQSRPRRREENYLWVPVILVWGPLGLLFWFLSIRNTPPSAKRLALLESCGDTAAPAAGMMLGLSVMLSFPEILGLPVQQVLLVLGLPLLVSLTMFNGLLISLPLNMGISQAMIRRLPHALIISMLALGGVSILVIPLANLALQRLLTLPLHLAATGTIGAMATLGSLPGLGFIWLYDRWTTSNGFRAWSSLGTDGGEYRFAAWRDLAWWFPLALALMAAGIFAGAMLSQFAQSVL